MPDKMVAIKIAGHLPAPYWKKILNRTLKTFLGSRLGEVKDKAAFGGFDPAAPAEGMEGRESLKRLTHNLTFPIFPHKNKKRFPIIFNNELEYP